MITAMTEQETLQRTPLFEEHGLLKAKMVPFGGWQMPLLYEGILAEYQHTRRDVTIFDTCHMGEFTIAGDCQRSGLDQMVTSAIKDMPLKSCRYGLILNNNGGTVDDLIVFRLDAQQWIIVVNGATTKKDREHFKKNLTSQTTFQDISLQMGKIDIQGPRSREVLNSLNPEIKKLDYYTFDFFKILGEYVLISRTGYTGELGYEIFYPWGKMRDLWRELLKNPLVKPAGLGARDVLRLEMGYSLYGHELEEDISPLEAGLNRFIDWNKEFIGKKALLEQKDQGPNRTLTGLLSKTRRSPRARHKIYASSGEEIGVVTSGSFSPSEECGIGLGFIKTGQAQKGQDVCFGDQDNKMEAVICGRSFFKQGSLKN